MFFLLFFLHIEPSSPQNFNVVSRSNLQVNFAWDRPSLTNGVVQAYTLRCTPNVPGVPEVSVTISVTFFQSNLQQSATLSNIRPDVSYTCSCLAINEAGSGPAVSLLLGIVVKHSCT